MDNPGSGLPSPGLARLQPGIEASKPSRLTPAHPSDCGGMG